MSEQQIRGLGQVAVRGFDMERAIGFYRDVIELPFLFQAGPNLAFFDCGGVRLMLDIPEDKRTDHPASVLYYRVEEIQSAYGALVARGAQAESEPHLVAKMPDHELWMAFFQDPEGNIVALMAEPRTGDTATG
jgi:methylmalonyl-CoA/ethylmalonyl-CoA epimerase